MKKVYDRNTKILENKTAAALISAVKQINEKPVRRRIATLHLIKSIVTLVRIPFWGMFNACDELKAGIHVPQLIL